MIDEYNFSLYFAYFLGAVILIIAGYAGYKMAKKEKFAPHPDNY